MNSNPLVVEYIKILHKEDSLYDKEGRSTQLGGEPSHKVGDLDEIRQIGLVYCCDDMKHYFKRGTIGFGQRQEEVYHNKIAEVFIRIKGESKNDIAIPYCPFCREAVMTCEIGVI